MSTTTKIMVPTVSDVILKYVMTEKSNQLLDNLKQVTLIVDKHAAKDKILEAFCLTYNVDIKNVLGIRTMIYKGKVRRFRGKLGKTVERKKAIISLSEAELKNMANLQDSGASKEDEAKKILE